MKKELQQHLIYGLILVVAVSGVLLFEDYRTDTTRQLVSSELGKINDQLNSLTSILDSTQQDITKLNASLEQKNTEIETLTGELQQVRIESQQQVSELQDTIDNLKVQNQDFSSVIEKSIPAVVNILTDKGSGSGFIIDTKGYVITNYHVISGISAATVVTSDGDRHSVSLLGYDADVDIAVLKIDPDNLKALEWGSSGSLSIGESVIAVGNPGGLDFSVTQGIVSAKREDSLGNQLIQIDVPINPGNSGGPLINSRGQVVGVNTKKLSGFEGVGFALASNYVDNYINDIIDSYETAIAGN